MTKKDKIILDLCGGTGAWSKPYKDAGYDVMIITLPEWDVTRWRDDGKFISFWKKGYNGWVECVEKKKIYGVLAAPPCTMFSRARTTAKTPRDFEGALKIVRACMDIIWAARSAGSLKFWAMENPMGLLRQFMGQPAYSFRGWEFGDHHVKFTDLWGYFNNPKKKRNARRPTFNRKKWASPKKPKQYADIKLTRADIRAITPAGFAKYFYQSNK